MNDIFYKLHCENNHTYIDVNLKFHDIIINESDISVHLQKVITNIYKTNINLYIANDLTNKIKFHKEKNFHNILHEKNIDLYFSIDESNCHFFSFSHHVMDGFSFLLFLIDFYKRFKKDKIHLLITDQLKKRKLNTNTNFVHFLEFCSNFIFKKNTHYLPLLKTSHTIHFLSNYIFHSKKNKSFNSHVCTSIEKTLIQMKIIKNDSKLLFGLPINYKKLSERKKLPYGNYICIIPDTCSLTFSKNLYVISFVLILTYIVSYFPNFLVNEISKYCIGNVDVLYSNIDAQLLDDVPYLESINYSVPARDENIMSFSCLTWKGQVFFNVGTKRNFSLNIFKSCFLANYECKD